MRIGPLILFERYVVEKDGDVYLTRWRLLQCPWFGLYLHRFTRPDQDRYLHDHPWDFCSVVLRGGYQERFKRGIVHLCRTRRTGSVAFHKAEALHRIVELYRTPTWTLVLTGRRRRQWGFLTADGWQDWRTYLNLQPTDQG